MSTINSINDIRRQHRGYWFDAPTMRFFRSRVGNKVYTGPGGVYFVSSEQFCLSDGSPRPRKYTVRQYDPVADDIETIGPFNVFSKSEAYYLAERFAKRDRVTCPSSNGEILDAWERYKP